MLGIMFAQLSLQRNSKMWCNFVWVPSSMYLHYWYHKWLPRGPGYQMVYVLKGLTHLLAIPIGINVKMRYFNLKFDLFRTFVGGHGCHHKKAILSCSNIHFNPGIMTDSFLQYGLHNNTTQFLTMIPLHTRQFH